MPVFDPNSNPRATTSSAPRWLGWLVFGLVFVAAWTWYTRHLDWPFNYHPDERGKARQVIEREYNHHHPMLMIISTERAVKLLRETIDFQRNYQSVTEVGRATVGFWLALGVAAVCTLGWRWYGWIGLGVMALAMVGSGSLYKLAHSFKEDGVLIGTLGLLLLAFDHWRRRLDPDPEAPARRTHLPALIWVGLIAGLVAASKYIGFLAWPVLLGLVAWLAPAGRRTSTTAACLGFALVGFLLGNYRLLTDFGAAWTGVSYEFESLEHGHHGVRDAHARLPHGQAITATRSFLPDLLWLPALAAPWLVARLTPARDGRRAWTTLLLGLGFSLLLLTALSSTFKFTYRYVAPIAWISLVSLAFATAALLDTARRRFPSPGPRLASLVGGLILLGGLVAHQFAGWDRLHPTPLAWHRAYGGTDFRDMRAAVDALPPDSVVLMPASPLLPADNVTMFDDIPRATDCTVLWDKGVTEDPTLTAVRAHSATHVLFPITFPQRYEREVEGSADAVERHLTRQAFWRALLGASQRIDSRPVPSESPRLMYGWDLRKLK